MNDPIPATPQEMMQQVIRQKLLKALIKPPIQPGPQSPYAPSPEFVRG